MIEQICSSSSFDINAVKITIKMLSLMTLRITLGTIQL
jgi:hypothetical protein